VLGKPHRADEKWDDELPRAGPSAPEDEPGEDDDKAFTTLSAHAELDQLIYEGTSFSADEEDYLGLPGLLEPEQVRTLLNQRPEGVDDARQASRLPRPRPGPRRRSRRCRCASGSTSCARSSTRWWALHNHRTKKPHGVIHSELRAHCGGPPTAMATIEQLEERIATIRSWH
jgi:hypothetical protein